MTWIEQEFRRTGLPRTALARYLERHKPVVSLIARGERQISAEEANLIRSFFSVVPPTPDSHFVAAVEGLKSTKLRTTVGLDLVRWFKRVPDQWPPHYYELAGSFLKLLKPVSEHSGILRADQIVAICRVAKIDLVALCGGHGAKEDLHGERLIVSADALAALHKAAELWMRKYGNVKKYEFERGGFESVAGQDQNAQVASLQVAESSISAFSGCEGFLLADDRAKPFFERGQTIFVSRTTPRRGDLVAVMMKDDKLGVPAAVIGRLAYDSPDAVAVDTARGQKKLEKKSDLELRRIDFCRL
jgi:hypothetical protein